jgi:hypothetical protein
LAGSIVTLRQTRPRRTPKTALELSTSDYKRNTTGPHRQSMLADLALGAHHLATIIGSPTSIVLVQVDEEV